MDRNNGSKGSIPDAGLVALRKESVDRNGAGSWPRMMHPVALRKESVDRNIHTCRRLISYHSRSPQGERG